MLLIKPGSFVRSVFLTAEPILQTNRSTVRYITGDIKDNTKMLRNLAEVSSVAKVSAVWGIVCVS